MEVKIINDRPVKIWTDNVEESAMRQIENLTTLPFLFHHLAIMPDVHAGMGMPIGGVLACNDAVIPNAVGVDIGCGMCAVKTSWKLENITPEVLRKKIMRGIRKRIPLGMDHHKEPQDEAYLPTGHDIDKTVIVKQRHISITKEVGTLGGGNHFIEIDRATDGGLYLIIHTGSRNLGKQVAEYYQQLAVELNQGREDYFKKRDALIAEYKAAGRRGEIQAALKELRWNEKPLTVPEDLGYVYGTYLEDYLHDVEICQQFARRNREMIAEILLSRSGLSGGEAFHTVHNYIDTREMILRKGAIAAHKGEKVLIPINMRDGSVLAIGRGNPDWNYSAPHGAGRLMSRNTARQTLDMAAYENAMQGIYTTSVNPATLDEAPMAYKSLEDIIGVIQDSVDVVDVMKPVYNFKAAD